MYKNILETRSYILGVDETWDNYYELTVKFIEEVTIGEYSYHHFIDESSNNSFYLKPRYTGQSIEWVMVQNVIVNIVSKDSNEQLRFRATGILKLKDK